MDDLVFHEKSRYKILLWNNLWEKWVLVARNADKGISDDLKHVLVVFWLKGAPNGPPRVLMAQNSQDTKLHCGMIQLWETGCYSYGRWSKEYLMI